jgi:hypothetical protein
MGKKKGSLKSEMAFKFNVERLFELSPEGVYFWTSTFAEVLTVKEGSKRWSAFSKELVREFGVFGIRAYELHDEHGLHIHWLVNRRLPVAIIRPMAQRLGFGRINVKACDKGVGDYLAKYLSKEERAPCLKGKRLWACFGPVPWSRVKDIQVRSWLGSEYWRLRGDAMEVTREQSYGFLQEAQLNYTRWIQRVCGIEVWTPPELPDVSGEIPY